MAYLNRQNAVAQHAYTDMAYPELSPVTERQLKRRPVQSLQRKHTSRAEYILYAAINAALIFGLIQCTRALIGNSINVSHLVQSQASVQQFYKQTQHENQLLNDKIKLYSSASGIEELARNYLNMVGENELPIRFQ